MRIFIELTSNRFFRLPRASPKTPNLVPVLNDQISRSLLNVLYILLLFIKV